jgi:hypothetical protein
VQLFDTPADYEACERVLAEAHEWVAMRTLAYCVMPNHRHLVLWPREVATYIWGCGRQRVIEWVAGVAATAVGSLEE